MALRSFRDDDAGYLAWRDENLGNGYVAKIDESGSGGTRVHHADCWTLRVPIEKGHDLTGPYPKVCSTNLAELELEQGLLPRCAHCMG
jgi:hypothetical protein